ncbi:helix-turn-helix domain-containing protein [Mesorhizobium sangaii]|uniref:Transcriptional regulator with XRE-family HTH domain n=1 Tax=Mesorhizobium sangaii TaxID=505389 RepID=A0A841PND7_9HYPH|nr:helix-turn-helix transcriptional regulator [Mesorhizobium sangaii]MBB6414178.1 transcriptional regulator with XRE-family HTH domain [Mesorhizobium sangaii]
MKRDDAGAVNNPLRANIALTLERERAKRGLSHMHMAELFRTAEGEKLAYRTYIQTVRQKNNVTLTTLQIMANGLHVAVAELLSGGKKKLPERAHQLDETAIRRRLAHIIDMERQRRNMLRYEMAELIGVAEATFMKLERASGNISVDTIAAIAKALKLDPATFLFRDKVPPT